MQVIQISSNPLIVEVRRSEDEWLLHQTILTLNRLVWQGKWEGPWYNPGDYFSILASSPPAVTETIMNGRWK